MDKLAIGISVTISTSQLSISSHDGSDVIFLFSCSNINDTVHLSYLHRLPAGVVEIPTLNKLSKILIVEIILQFVILSESALLGSTIFRKLKQNKQVFFISIKNQFVIMSLDQLLCSLLLN